ncbi:MAG: hypothetical protein JW820_13895 [Spirochaetales bacterium]|nr:hypothetical protein [Spirochaetales bacterium]
MRKIIVLIIVLAVVGLVVGYLIFARTEGGYVSLKALLRPTRHVLDELVKKVTGIETIRKNILVSGGVGAVAGLVLGVAAGARSARRRKRR